MPQSFISYQSTVPPWECDIVEHFTVAYYYEKLDFATAVALSVAGLDPTDTNAPVMTQCLTSYSAELRKGDIYHIETMQLAPDKLGHRLVNSASGKACSHFEQTLSQPLPDLPVDASSVETEWDGPEHKPSGIIEEGSHWITTGRSIVSQKDCGLNGLMSSSACIHQFSGAGSHFKTHFGMTPEYMRDNRIGFSTFAFDISFTGTAKLGTSLTTESCLGHIGRSSMRMVHRLIRAHDGVEICRLSQMGVHLDMEARSSSPFPKEMAAAAKEFLPA